MMPRTTITGMSLRIPGGPSPASGPVTATVAVGAGVAVGSGVGVGVAVGAGVGVGSGVAVGSGVGVGRRLGRGRWLRGWRGRGFPAWPLPWARAWGPTSAFSSTRPPRR